MKWFKIIAWIILVLGGATLGLFAAYFFVMASVSVQINIMKEHEHATKTSTPLKHHHPLIWYVKWTASLIVTLGMILTANNVYPINLIFHFVGLGGWLAVAIAWNDRALIVVNAVALAIFANGLVAYFVKVG